MKNFIYTFLIIFIESLLISNISNAQNQEIAFNSYFGGNTATQKFTYDGTSLGHYSIGWYTVPGSAEARLSGYGGIKFFTNSTPQLIISKYGNVGIGTSSPDAQVEIKTPLESPGMFKVNKWSNTHNDGYLLELQTIWGTHGINHVFVQKFSNVEYNSLSFFKGRVGVGTTEPDALFTVNGTIHSKEVKVDLNVPAPDYVFKSDYQLLSLNEVKEYINKNSHLPEIPSAAEMETEGIEVGEMNMLLLKKIEELTLYQIQQNEELEKLKKLEQKHEQQDALIQLLLSKLDQQSQQIEVLLSFQEK